MFLSKLRSLKFSSIKVLIFYYVVFLITTALFCLLNILKLNSVTSSQEGQYYLENIKSTKYKIEAELADVKGVLDQLSNSRYVEELLYFSDSDPNLLNNKAYDIYTLVKQLRSIKSSLRQIEHIGIFIKGSNMVIDNFSAYNASDYYNNIFKLKNVDASRWYGLTDEFQNFCIMPSDEVSFNGYKINGYTYIKTIPPNNIISKGVIFATVKSSYLENLIQSMDIDVHTSGAIIDDKNNIIVTSKNFKNYPLPDYSLYSIQEFIHSDDNSVSYMALPVKNLSWKLVLIKKNNYSNKISYIGVNIILVLSVILLLGILVSVLLNKYYSKTFEVVSRNIDLYLSGNKEPIMNRRRLYKVFEQKFKGLVNEISSLNETISQYKNIIKDSGSEDLESLTEYNPDCSLNHVVLPLSKENLINRYLKSGNFDEIEALIKQALNDENKSGNISPADLYANNILFHELLALIIRYFEEEKNNLKIPQPDYCSIKTYDDILVLVKQLCILQKNELKTEKNVRTIDQKNEIIKFIDDNFLDHNLSLKIVKDKFNISLSLITKTIKDLTGEGFLDYLNKKRIRHAKKLLQCSEVTISKARELSGYNDDSVFIKVFKKYEGKTPGEYRKQTQFK